MTKLRTLIRGLAALTVLLAGTIGAPIGLWIFGQDLLPGRVPSLPEIWATLRTPDNGRYIPAVMLIVATIAWLIFTGCVLAELAARLTRRTPIRLPGLRLPQAAVGTLIGIVLAGALTFSTPPPAAADPLPALPGGPVPVATAPRTVLAGGPAGEPGAPVPMSAPGHVASAGLAGGNAVAGPEWVVRKGDTLWAIAERTLGDPLRFPEIVDLNTGRTQPDGGTLVSGDWLHIGWTLRLPGDAHPTLDPAAAGSSQVMVVPGDTLSEIAADHHHTLDQVWAANTGRTQPDGDILTDPDLIKPGWTIIIPAENTPTTVPAEQAEPPAAPPDAMLQQPVIADPVDDEPVIPSESPAPPPVNPQVSETGAAVSSTSPGTFPPTPSAAPGPVTPSIPATTSATTRTTAASTSPGPAIAEPGNETHDESGWDSTAVAFGMAGAALLAGSVALTLARLRRRQYRHRRPGRTITEPPAALADAERALRDAGRAAHLDVSFLDDALRGLPIYCAAAGIELPTVIAAQLSPTAFALVLDRPAQTAPHPWQVDSAGTRWTLNRDDNRVLTDAEREWRIAPYPALVSVAHTRDGDHWLLDLEQLGTLSLHGDPTRCGDLARFIAAELAHHPWSEMLQITVIGDHPELAALSPQTLHVVTTDPAPVVRAAAVQHHDSANAQVRVLAGRADNTDIDNWAPHVLILDSDITNQHAEDLTELSTVLGGPDRSPVALILITGDDDPSSIECVPTKWMLTVDADGSLQAPELGIAGIAEQLPATEAAQLGELLRYAADLTGQPAPPSDRDEPWEQHADTLGSLLSAPGVNRHRESHGLHLASKEPETSVLPMPPRAYTSTTATTPDDIAAVAPAVTAAARHRVELADPQLDADLADWHDPDCHRPKIRVLGPITVEAHGNLPAERPQMSAHVEVVVYLATRAHGATVEQFATDLWPDDPTVISIDGKAKPKVRQKISAARKWLGDDPNTGLPYLPTVAGSRDAVYRINHALVDGELFRRLRLRGTARGADGLEDLHTALTLVTGVPFDQQRPGGYGWLAQNALDHDYTTMIVDVAHTVATHHLHADEPMKAIEASKVALLAGAWDDITRLDLIGAYKATGDNAGANLYLQQLMTAHGAEVEEDLPPRTLAILDGRDWHQMRSS